jgi:hypothetical protein
MPTTVDKGSSHPQNTPKLPALTTIKMKRKRLAATGHCTSEPPLAEKQRLKYIPMSDRLSPPPPPKNRRAETSFLSLPHELRQVILLQSHQEEFFFCWHSVWEGLHDSWFKLFKFHFRRWQPRSIAWVQALRQKHTDIDGDVDFVERKWIEQHQKALPDAERIWRRRRQRLRELQTDGSFGSLIPYRYHKEIRRQVASNLRDIIDFWGRSSFISLC